MSERLEFLAYQWAVRCFGMDHVHDDQVRVIRLLEEVAELAQALEVDQDVLLRTVEVVYGRPANPTPEQELGGVAMTLAVLLHRRCTSYESMLLRELDRVLARSPEHFAGRNAEKIALGLVGLHAHRPDPIDP